MLTILGIISGLVLQTNVTSVNYASPILPVDCVTSRPCQLSVSDGCHLAADFHSILLSDMIRQHEMRQLNTLAIYRHTREKPKSAGQNQPALLPSKSFALDFPVR